MAHEYNVLGTTFVFSECITCGVSYAVPKAMWDAQRQQGGYHHCSNGHSQGWSKSDSENEKLRRERDRLKQQEARLLDEKREQIERALKAEAQIKRLKKRSAAGTCPCCTRTFTNMSRHMKTKHPEFIAENVVKLRTA